MQSLTILLFHWRVEGYDGTVKDAGDFVGLISISGSFIKITAQARQLKAGLPRAKARRAR